MQDLFQDLRDGQNLISLLESLSKQSLPREKGRMRVHQLQNIQIALNFIRFRKVKLVNISPEDIVDGNQKLTLGLIWTIILHFQVSNGKGRMRFLGSIFIYLAPSLSLANLYTNSMAPLFQSCFRLLSSTMESVRASYRRLVRTPTQNLSRVEEEAKVTATRKQ